MPYIYLKVDELKGKDKVGSKQCVALLQHYAKLRQTALWKEGNPVIGDISIIKGTAIATFVNGKYPNKNSGNHAAFYISQDATGIWMMDQWSDDVFKPKISPHHIKRKGKYANGGYIDPSNNADAYSIIE